MNVAVKVDDREVRELLARYTAASVNKVLRRASTAAGAAMKKVIRPAVPVGPTGNLRRSVRAKRIRTSGVIGVVVGPMGQKASHRHLVAGGTKAHVIRGKPMLSTPYGVFGSVQHPGSRAAPYIDNERAAAAGLAAAEQIIDQATR